MLNEVKMNEANELNELFHTIHQLSRKLNKDLNGVLQSFSIYSGQWSVIYTLKQKGTMTQSELCEYLSIEAPPVTRMLQRLESEGFVNRVTGEDKRAKYIKLSERALQNYPVWEEAVLKRNKEIVEGFSSKDELLSLLKQLLTQLDKR